MPVSALMAIVVKVGAGCERAQIADVFISYKREDRQVASKLASVLGAELSVFFDADIPVGDSWDQYIERELLSASAVVVLWSSRSVSSRWVRLEARHALQRGVLVPVLLEPCEVPLEFQDIQAAILGHNDEKELAKLFERVRRLCGAVQNGDGQRIFPTTPPAPKVIDPDHYGNYLNYGCALCESLSELLSGEADADFQAQSDRMVSQLKRAVGLMSGASDSEDGDTIEVIRENVWEAANLLSKASAPISAKRMGEAKERIDEAATDICFLLGFRSRFQHVSDDGDDD